MCENARLLDFEMAADKEECKTDIASYEENEREKKEQFQFEEETLQITDVHEFELNGQDDHSDHDNCDLSATASPGTLSEIKLHNLNPNNNTSTLKEIDLQSELAALGFSSTFSSSPSKSMSASFDDSLDKSFPILIDSGERVLNQEKHLVSLSETIQTDFKGIGRVQNAIQKDFEISNNIKTNTHGDLNYDPYISVVLNQSDNDNSLNQCSNNSFVDSCVLYNEEGISSNNSSYLADKLNDITPERESYLEAQTSVKQLFSQANELCLDNLKQTNQSTDDPQELLINTNCHHIEVKNCSQIESHEVKLEGLQSEARLKLSASMIEDNTNDQSCIIHQINSTTNIEGFNNDENNIAGENHLLTGQTLLEFKDEIRAESNKIHQEDPSFFEGSDKEFHETNAALPTLHHSLDGNVIHQPSSDFVAEEILSKSDLDNSHLLQSYLILNEDNTATKEPQNELIHAARKFQGSGSVNYEAENDKSRKELLFKTDFNSTLLKDNFDVLGEATEVSSDKNGVFDYEKQSTSYINSKEENSYNVLNFSTENNPSGLRTNHIAMTDKICLTNNSVAECDTINDFLQESSLPGLKHNGIGEIFCNEQSGSETLKDEVQLNKMSTTNDYIAKGNFHVEQSYPEWLHHGIQTKEEVESKDDILKCSAKLQSSNGDINNSEKLIINETPSEDDGTQDICHGYQHNYKKNNTVLSEEILINSFVTDKSITQENSGDNSGRKRSDMMSEDIIDLNLIKDTNQDQHYSFDPVKQDEYKLNEAVLTGFTGDMNTLEHHLSEMDYEDTISMEHLPQKFFNTDPQASEAIYTANKEDTLVVKEFKAKSCIEEVTHQEHELSDKVVVKGTPTLYLEDPSSENVVSEGDTKVLHHEEIAYLKTGTGKINILKDFSIEPFKEESNSLQKSLVKDDVAKKTTHANSLTVDTIEEINSIDCLTEESSNQIKEDFVNCCLTNNENPKEDAASSFDTLNPSCQTSDMSLTTFCIPSNDLDSSKLSRESEYSPMKNYSQTMTNFSDYSDIKETNVFTSFCDQKAHDVLYLPVYGHNIKECSMVENSLQSFMEITMANTNEARINQCFTNLQKQQNKDFKQNFQGLENTNDSQSEHQSNISGCHENKTLLNLNNSSTFKYDYDEADTKKHEIMQQSMSDYVTNLSLNLTIPDSCNFPGVMVTDKNTQKQCEMQAESVLLMKWPAQYHNDILILKQQNHSLLESCNLKDIFISKLKTNLREFIKNISNENLSREIDCFSKHIESECDKFKIESKEILSGSIQRELVYESNVSVLQNKIKELEHELMTINQTVIHLKLENQKLSEIVESVHTKKNQIDVQEKDKLFLEEELSCASNSLETIDQLKQENCNLNCLLKIEREKIDEFEKLKILFQKQENEIWCQNEKLLFITEDQNVKEQQIQDLYQNKVELEEKIASLDNHLKELHDLKEENVKLNLVIQETKCSEEKLLVHNKSLEKLISFQVESISKLDKEISEKDRQLEIFKSMNADLKLTIESHEQRLKDLQEFEVEIQRLTLNQSVKDEKLKEIMHLKSCLEDQVLGLKTQNDLLWNELKVTSSKEHSLYALKEEKVQLEEKISQMKREVQDIENFRSDNEQLVAELTDKIRNLTSDKKKLKSSLIKANDELNERDAEITKLNEEKAMLESNLVELTNNYENINFERSSLEESIGGVSEYLSSLFHENIYLVNEVVAAQFEGDKISAELISVKNEIGVKNVSFHNMRLEEEKLKKSLDNRIQTIERLTSELNHYKLQCDELVKSELKLEELKKSVNTYEDEKISMQENMSSLSETVSSLLIDRQLLYEQERNFVDLTNRLDLISSEKWQLEQINSELRQSFSCLQNQLEIAKDKDRTIKNLQDLSTSLENHLSSLNEELMSELSTNQYLKESVNKIEKQLMESNEQLLLSQSSTFNLTEQLNISTERNKDLQEMVATLENCVSSLNEELLSEIAKNHFFSIENENLVHQYDQIREEKFLLENKISCAIGSIKDRLLTSNRVSKEELLLQTCVNEILEHIRFLECENIKLSHDLNSVHNTLQTSKEEISLLLESEENLKLNLSQLTEQNHELRNKLNVTLANESYIMKLEKELESLSKVSEDEKHNLKLEVQKLSETNKALHNQFSVQLQDSLNLKDVMSKEIHSLTGEMWDAEVEPLINVYQKFVKELLNKEKEVIFSLQKDYENKLEYLKNDLNEKSTLIGMLESEIDKYKINSIQRDTCISSLQNEICMLKTELNCNSCKLEEIRLEADKEKETLIEELNSKIIVITQLKEKIINLTDEVNCKNNEILQWKSDLEKIQCETSNLIKRSEEDLEVSKHQKDLLDELTLSLNDKQKLLSQLNVQLIEKSNETSELTECIKQKDTEITQCLKKIEEMTTDVTKLTSIENDLNVLMKTISKGEDGELNDLIDSLKTSQLFSNSTQSVVSKFVKILETADSSCKSFQSKILNQIEINKCLETQISDLNEELKSCKILYDEDSLQYKEEIAAKSLTISQLTNTLEQLKSNDLINDNFKNKNAEVEDLQDQISKLKEENSKLQGETAKMTYLTGVNRKLSWEIEELSRCIKFEKQNNTELKAKFDLVNNQINDMSKKNFQLEDKIYVLERKLETHDVLSSLKIDFPFGINTVDKQVQYLNEKLAEYGRITAQHDEINTCFGSLKHEYEKSKDYIKKQDDKLNKVMKRELELKKQLASTKEDMQLLKEIKSELLNLFPCEELSMNEVLLKIKSTVAGENYALLVKNPESEHLKEKIEALSQENKDLDAECEMMNKHIEEQKELLVSVFKREEELKKLNSELETKLSNHLQSNVGALSDAFNLKEFLDIFPEKPVSLKDALNMARSVLSENKFLKDKIVESQEEYASLDKECEEMFKAYKEKERDLADVLKRETSTVSDLKNKQKELELELESLLEKLQTTRSQLASQESKMFTSEPCQCEELKSRLSELRVDLAERNAKITALEMQFEADNFPLKKRVADLEKSLDQAKHKVNELKSEVRRYQEQMCDVTVGLRAECERCRSLGTIVDGTSTTSLQLQIQEKNKEIHILKALCKTRNQRIKELEERDGSCKMPRLQRSALKEVNENNTAPLSPTKPIKASSFK